MSSRGGRTVEDIRKEKNKDLIRRMREGDSLRSYDAQSSWFPPRPVIEKDQHAIKALYKEPHESSDEENSPAEEKTPSQSKLLRLVIKD